MGVLARSVALLAAVHFVAACAHASNEYGLKAAFLLNFARYVEWPPAAFSGADGPLRIGVAGRDPFDGELDRALAGKSAAGRPLTSRAFSDPSEAHGFHMVFVSRDQAAQLPALLAAAGTSPVLFVGESDGFCRAGGDIELYLEDEHIRFRINPAHSARAGLAISSKLLHLATLVH